MKISKKSHVYCCVVVFSKELKKKFLSSKLINRKPVLLIYTERIWMRKDGILKKRRNYLILYSSRCNKFRQWVAKIWNKILFIIVAPCMVIVIHKTETEIVVSMRNEVKQEIRWNFQWREWHHMHSDVHIMILFIEHFEQGERTIFK